MANTIILNGEDTTIGMANTLWINEAGTNTLIQWAGGITGTVNGTYTRAFWCVQLLVDINLGVKYNTLIDFADTPNLQRVGWMMKNELASVTTPTLGAAFQLAIWDVIEDNGDGFDVGKGNVYQSTDPRHPTDSGVLTAAQAYEAQSLGQSWIYTPIYHNTTIIGGTPVQNLVGPLAHDGGPLGEAPEPKDVALVVGGLALIVAGRWRSHARR